MDFQELKNKLREDLKRNELEHFFAKTQQYISKNSDLQGILLLLANRTRRLKMSVLSRTISFENEGIEKNKIVQSMLEVIDTIDAEDLQVKNVETSVATLLAEIQFREKEFQNIIDDKSNGLIRIGQNLIQLGGILREKPSPDDSIPYEEKIKIGTKKGVRRLKLGFLELKELRTSLLAGVENIATAHEKLVEYLDFPKEEIGKTQLDNIKNTVNDLEVFIQKIKPDDNVESEQISKAKDMFQQVLPFKEQLGKPFEVFFQNIEAIIPKCEEIMVFLKENNNTLADLKNKLKSLSIELKLNLEEKGF